MHGKTDKNAERWDDTMNKENEVLKSWKYVQRVVKICSKGHENMFKRSWKYAERVVKICSKGHENMFKGSWKYVQRVVKICLRGLLCMPCVHLKAVKISSWNHHLFVNIFMQSWAEWLLPNSCNKHIMVADQPLSTLLFTKVDWWRKYNCHPFFGMGVFNETPSHLAFKPWTAWKLVQKCWLPYLAENSIFSASNRKAQLLRQWTCRELDRTAWWKTWRKILLD